jgi:integrase
VYIIVYDIFERRTMPRLPQPFKIERRSDSKTWLLTLSTSSGLPARICLEWKRKSFANFPKELVQYRAPRNKSQARTAAFALIEYLKRTPEQGRVSHREVTVGTWLSRFTSATESPRAARLTGKNRPYSAKTLKTYESYYRGHLKDDPICGLKMVDLEETDALALVARLALHPLKTGGTMGGTRTFETVVKFVRMAFTEYERISPSWRNPFRGLDAPKAELGTRDALEEREMIRLFRPDVLRETMEIAVCAAMFLSGLRRGEIFALKNEDLDWVTPKIVVRRAWQAYESKERQLGPPKGKRARSAPFDPLLQEAIRRLRAENGLHDFVFANADGSLPGSSWIREHFKRWLLRAGITLNGRKITPHSSRHSLASLLEKHGVPLRYIQDLLGHSDYKTTKGYLHSTEDTIRGIGVEIEKARREENATDIAVFSTKPE